MPTRAVVSAVSGKIPRHIITSCRIAVAFMMDRDWRTCPAQAEGSMRYLLQLAFLLAALADSTAFAADHLIRLAQVVTPGQVAPVPLVPTPLISSQASTACVTGCDTQAMTCQNACVAAPPTATASSLFAAPTISPNLSAPCVLNCTTQQLLCKRVCYQPAPNLR